MDLGILSVVNYDLATLGSEKMRNPDRIKCEMLLTWFLATDKNPKLKINLDEKEWVSYESTKIASIHR